MSSWLRSYYKLFNLLLSIWVKSKVIPIDPVLEYKIDSTRPIIYILPYDSKADLLTLRLQCIKYDLPDPLTMLEIDGICLPRYLFIHNGPRIFSYFVPNYEFVKLFNSYLDLHYNKPQFDIQILQVLVMFGRCPERNIQKSSIPSLRMLNGIQKFFSILWYGRDTFVYFSPIVSLRRIANKKIKDDLIAIKLAQSAHIHFSCQQLASIGPYLPARRDIFNKILHLKSINKAIEDEARKKKISYKIAQKNAMKIMKEIAANFSYEIIRITDRIMGYLCNHLFQGMQINGIERVRQLAQNGHEIIYIPCHRSHMDYLLLSYVIYNQGLVPPHIVAGINLNFWPVGPILCRLGAIFIRRNFKSHKLYALIFREYLIELFSKGYSIEYFIEGSRSRTGRLLVPKTGTLSMTIQTMLRGGIRPITFIPVYIGYEHIIEVSTYNKELRGKKKEKEGFLQIIRSLCNLSKLGQSYINFGKPLIIFNYLNKKVPEWYKVINPIESQRPIWMTPIINDIATLLMVRINAASAINPMNLCVTALLSSNQHSLSRNQLIKQLECYTQLLSNVPYSSEATLVNIKPEVILNQAISMNKFETEKDSNIGDIIILTRKQAVLMTYYRNNIHHMLAIPSLIAIIVQQYREISKSELLRQVILIYPMLKNELFLHWNKSDLPILLHNLLNELVRQELIIIQDSQLKLSVDRYITLKLLASGISETLQRFAIVFSILKVNPTINRTSLEKKSCELAQQLSVLYGVHSPEFFDKAVFSTLVVTLQDVGYINDKGISNIQNVYIMHDILAKLVTNDVCFTIESLLTYN